MKKTLIIILALMLAFLPACSGASHQQDEGTQTAGGSGSTTDSAETSDNQETGESGQTNGEPGQSAEDESNPQSEESNQPATPPEPRDFTVLGCAGEMIRYYGMWKATEDAQLKYMNEWIGEFPAWQKLQEMMGEKGIRILPEIALEDDYENTLLTRMASENSVPVFCFSSLSAPRMLELAEEGKILDIYPLLEAGDGTAKQWLEEKPWTAAGLRKATVEGHLWWLPNMNFVGYNHTPAVYGRLESVMIRQDWLEQYELEMPKTLEEYETALATFKEWDPSGMGVGNPGINVYTSAVTQWQDAQAGWFGLVAGLVGVDQTSGTVCSPWQQENAGAYLSWMQHMWEEGLLEESNLDNDGPESTRRMMIAENRVAAYSGYIMGSSFEPLIEASRDINGNITSCYVAMEPVMAVEGTEPLLRQHAPVDLSGGYFFTSALTDPSLDADFLNVYFSKESFDLINYGVEGVNYVMENGERRWLGDKPIMECNVKWEYPRDNSNRFVSEKIDTRMAYGRHLYAGILFPDSTIDCLDAEFAWVEEGGYSGKQEAWMQPKAARAREMMGSTYRFTAADPEACLAYATRDEQAQLDTYYEQLVAASRQMMLEIILEERSVDELPEILSQLEELGLSDMIQISQDRYDRFQGK